MKIGKKLELVFLSWAFTSVPLLAGGINWGSALFGDTFQDSQGQPLDSSWTFYLGYFESDFIPTLQNRSQWGVNWTTLDITNYDPDSSEFNSSWENDGVSDGNRGYIWGLNRNLPANEWILMRNDSWIVPVDSPINPSVNWETTEVTTFAAGSEPTEQTFVTEVTTGEPPLLLGSEWLALNFEPAELNDPQIGSFDADPDQDGLSNLEEFAFGTEPKTSDTICIEIVIVGSVFKFRSPKVRQVGVNYSGQVSSDLDEWEVSSAQVVLEADELTSLLFRDLTPITQSPRFARIAIQLVP